VSPLRLTALLAAVALAVPAAVLILRGMAASAAGDVGETGRRRALEAVFALTPIVLLAVLIALSAARA
jgi:hypothetical protein